jgi:single-stranded-DNA-specific exonuclease
LAEGAPTWDVEARLADLTVENALLIQQLSPFGQMNEVPRLLVKNALVLEVMMMGKEGNHARVRIADEEGVERTAVMFFHNGDAEKLVKGERYSFVGELSINEWKGTKSPQYKLISHTHESRY